MKTFTIREKRDLVPCLHYLEEQSAEDWPLAVRILPLEKDRSLAQNALSHMWYEEAAKQMQDESAQDKKAWCKLHIGVGIVKACDPEYARQYDLILRPLPYEAKMEAMKPPIEWPVTSLMKVKQMAEYLEAVDVHFSGQGVDLPRPDDLVNEAMGRRKK